MKKVYFYLIFDDVGVNECSDGFGGTEYGDSIRTCFQSKLYNSIELAFESKEDCGSDTSPIIEGWVKE